MGWVGLGLLVNYFGETFGYAETARPALEPIPWLHEF